jgi:hypothetical protein
VAFFLAGQKPTATELETHFDAWDTYVPTWTTSGTQPSIGNGALAGKYKAIGKTIHFMIGIKGGTTTTWGGAAQQWNMGLPVSALYPGTSPWDVLRPIGIWMCHDLSTATSYWEGSLLLGTSGSVVLAATRVQPAGTLQTLNNGNPIAIPATGDWFHFIGTYEAA